MSSVTVKKEDVQATGGRPSVEPPGKDDVLIVSSLGGGLKIIHDRKVEFDHHFADKLLKMTHIPIERPLRNAHFVYLTNCMRRGTFHPEWVIIVTCEYKGEEYRMNGQHTSWARLEMPAKWPCQVRWLKYKAETDNDLRLLYASIDRGASRTRSNVINAYLSGQGSFENVAQSHIRLIAQGFVFWMWETHNQRTGHDADEVAFLLQTKHATVAIKVAAFLMTLSKKHNAHAHMWRGPVVAAMFATMSRAPSQFDGFWGAVRDGVGMEDKDDPRLRLRNELMATSLMPEGRSPGKSVSREKMYRQCIHCWNSWRKGDKKLFLHTPLDTPRPTAK